MKILTIGVQVGVTFILTVGIYMVFALLDYEGGFDAFVGLTIFHPVVAIILSALTIACCLVIGLPIRLIRTLNRWWTNHLYVAICLTIVGLSFLGLSLTPQFLQQTTVSIDGKEMTKSIPHTGLVITGWLLTTFSALHIYPPSGLLNKAQNFLTNLTGIK